jgi:gamma-glutamylcyclotransferase (GGCT)/AIG2-like uncharacterized protein YtfP
MHKVFVYGTLKSGYGNNVLLKGSTFKSTGVTLRLFTVLSSGFPVAFATERPKHRLSGEIYQVDDKTLAQLDRLESNGSMYKRRRVVINTPTGTEVCWMYIGVYRHWAYSFKHMPEVNVVNGVYRFSGGTGVIGSELDADFCEYAAIRRPMRSSNHFMGQNFSCFGRAKSNKFIFARKHHELGDTRMVIGNLVPLDAELKEKFQKLFRAAKRNTPALAKQAFQIHNEHYLRTNRKYDEDFELWWEAQGLEQVFGSRGNWTKWYRAGEALEKVHAQFEKYANKLPTTRDSLYEIALLQPDELRLCLENNYSRSSVAQPEAEWKRPKRLQPVINPGATASSIRSWRKNWREPRQPRADKRTLAFITIRIHRSLYDFDKSGQPTGVIAAGQAVETSPVSFPKIPSGAGLAVATQLSDHVSRDQRPL